MKFFKAFTLVAVVLLFFLDASAQKLSKYELEADDLNSMGFYAKAIDAYKIAYEKTTEEARKAEIIFKTAICYRSLGESKSAELWFKKAVKVKYPDPIVRLFYADALKQNALYTEAAVEYKAYSKLVPDDPRGPNGVKSCELSSKWIEKPTRYSVENMALFNSKGSDFSPVFSKKDFKEIYFSSNRTGATGDNVSEITGYGFYDLFTTSIDRKGKWSEAVPLPGEFVNTADDEGASSLTLKGNMLYFSRCKIVKKKILGCKIYNAVKKGNVWGEVTQVVVNGAGDSIDVRHPAISPDELFLYFSSNLPGGQGGADIWMLKRSKKSEPWSDPINMGPEINTPGNEGFPYVRDNGDMFFSSDGHIGMGGLDIFKASKDKSGKYKVSNMQSPINSPMDDLGIIFEGNQERGFFASNRKGGKGMDDIYYFYLPPIQFTISGIVRNERTEQIIPGAKVILTGSDGTTQEMLSEADGSYKFKLAANTDYQLLSTKDEFLKGKGGESTKNIEESKDFKLDLLMMPIDKPIKLDNIFFDLGKWDLRPESMVSLDALVKILNENMNITIELGSHTDFRNSNEANQVLSQKRAQSVVNYLIEKGIEQDRLVAKGYGEESPATVDSTTAAKYPGFLQPGTKLTEPFIKGLSTIEEQEVAHQLNRRTEFKVLSTNYVSKKPPVNIPPTTTPTIENTEGGGTEGGGTEGGGTEGGNTNEQPNNNTEGGGVQ